MPIKCFIKCRKTFKFFEFFAYCGISDDLFSMCWNSRKQWEKPELSIFRQEWRLPTERSMKEGRDFRAVRQSRRYLQLGQQFSCQAPQVSGTSDEKKLADIPVNGTYFSVFFPFSLGLYNFSGSQEKFSVTVCRIRKVCGVISSSFFSVKFIISAKSARFGIFSNKNLPLFHFSHFSILANFMRFTGGGVGAAVSFAQGFRAWQKW